MENRTTYDVLILGSSLSGTIAASILARHGKRVLMLEKGTHPRFAIGEATTPDISFRFKVVALKYDVPELMNLSAFYKLRDTVGASSGLKRAFSFLYHRGGQPQNPQEAHQYPTLSPPMGPDCHFFRQDVDAYLLSVAMQYGADVRQQTALDAIDFDDGGVTVTTSQGERFRAAFVIDAAGHGSPLAKKFELRGDPNTFRTNSRGMFTHMIGVRLYDQVAEPKDDYGVHHPLSQGTLHHVFDGGWFWIIPFNNHADAVNPLCSVGLILDRNVYPETGMDAAEEFWHFVKKFPAVARQFEGARAIRPWIASRGRLQFCSTRMTGPRYALMPSAAAFIDPLFSSGINLTLSGIDLLMSRLLKALDTGDFSEEPFQEIDAFFRVNFERYDQMIAGAFTSFGDYELWDAWYRVWVVGLLLSTALNANLYLRYRETGDRSLFDRIHEPPYNRALGLAFPAFQRDFDRALAELDAVRDGSKTATDAAHAIRALFRETDYLPHYWRWHDPAVRSTPAFTITGLARMYFWYRLHAPREVWQPMYAWKPLTAFRYIFNAVREQSRASKRRRRFFVRDIFKAWNRDWTLDPA